jgi:hypothetical protein
MNFSHKELIGSGESRLVFAHDNPEWCVKVQKRDYFYCNANYRESFIYNQFPQYRHFLAPVIAISDDKQKLIMIRGKPVNSRQYQSFIHNIPSWFHDIKQENFIILNKKIVICDYARTTVLYNLKKEIRSYKKKDILNKMIIS